MPDFTLRPVRDSDAENIIKLWNPWILETAITFNPLAKTRADICALIAQRAAAGQAFLLAEAEDGGLLGFAGYSQFRGGPGYLKSQEHTIILAAEARGRGVGRRLMTAIEDHARKAGNRLMIAGVSGENPEARAFHEAIGYQLWGKIPDAGFKFGRHMDLWLLGKTL